VGCSGHQSRLSKGVIAKVVQLLKLAARFCVAAMKKATAAVAFPKRTFARAWARTGFS
jgi:hypothetical protein